MVALSVSISTSTSPISTRSPGCLCQVAMAPSSIVSERRGMLISIMALTHLVVTAPNGVERLVDRVAHVVVGRQCRALERLAVGHRHLGHGDAAYRRVEVVKRPVRDGRGDLGPDAVGQPVVFEYDRRV